MKFNLNWREKNPPGEPLFTLDEVAEKLGIPALTLRGISARFPGLKVWRHVGDSTSVGTERVQYRMSDVRRWWATIPEANKEKAKRKLK